MTIPAIAKLTGHTGSDWWTESPAARLRFLVLDVENHTLLIYMEAPDPEFEVFTNEADHVLQTLEFAER